MANFTDIPFTYLPDPDLEELARSAGAELTGSEAFARLIRDLQDGNIKDLRVLLDALHEMDEQTVADEE